MAARSRSLRCGFELRGALVSDRGFAAISPALPISNPERLAELRPRLGRGEIEAVSIHSRMLSAEIVQELKQSGVRTMTTWAVETEADARRVLGYGATGVTSKNLVLLAAIWRGELGEAPS